MPVLVLNAGSSSVKFEREIPHRVVDLLEPGRYRMPRIDHEQAHQASASLREHLFPKKIVRRLVVTHTRPEVVLGILRPLHTGLATSGLGYISHGGTLNTPELLFVNHASWAHCLAEAARLLDVALDRVLTPAEVQALHGQRSPHGIIIPEVAAGEAK